MEGRARLRSEAKICYSDTEHAKLARAQAVAAAAMHKGLRSMNYVPEGHT